MGHLARALFAFLLLPLAAPGAQVEFPEAFSAAPIAGRVVDASTEQPVAGAILVAQWILYHSTPGGQNPHTRLQVLETVTGPDGSYRFPGWGPLPNPIQIIQGLFYCCHFTVEDPQISVFTPGYRPLRLLNRRPLDRQSALRTSLWDGQTIRLEPFRGSRKQWAQALGFLQTGLGWRQGDWRLFPRMIYAVETERLTFPQDSIHLRMSGLGAYGINMDQLRYAVRGAP